MKLSRRSFVGASAAVLAGAAAVSGRVQAASIPEAGNRNLTRHAASADAAERPIVPAGGDAQRLDLAVAHEWGLEGIPPRRRAGGARNGAGNESPSVGLQRPSRRGRPSNASRADKVRIFVSNKLPEHTTVHWHGFNCAQRYGRRRWPEPAPISSRARRLSMSSF